MTTSLELQSWIAEVRTHFPNLSKPQATGLALWSFGMILVRSCALTAVASFLAKLLAEKFQTVRERLRDLYREADAKAGQHRAQLNLDECWAPWLNWVLEGWSGRQLALALDATTLGQRFVVLAISVLYRGCAVPVAWKVLRATEKHPWQPEWLALLKHFSGLVPRDWTVIVMADRGLYAPWLFRAIHDLGWHPMLRVNQQATFRPQGESAWQPLTDLVPAVGRAWTGLGTLFQGPQSQLECTLLAHWGAGHEEPWFVVTDLPPSAAEVAWYGLRAWIEQGFKRTKRGGWQWQYTRMTDPARAERLWLAMALATWWVLSVGGEAEADTDAEGETKADGETNAALPADTGASCPGAARRRSQGWRWIAAFREGWNTILAALLTHRFVPVGHGAPEAWPTIPLAQNGYP